MRTNVIEIQGMVPLYIPTNVTTFYDEVFLFMTSDLRHDSFTVPGEYWGYNFPNRNSYINIKDLRVPCKNSSYISPHYEFFSIYRPSFYSSNSAYADRSYYIDCTVQGPNSLNFIISPSYSSDFSKSYIFEIFYEVKTDLASYPGNNPYAGKEFTATYP